MLCRTRAFLLFWHNLITDPYSGSDSDEVVSLLDLYAMNHLLSSRFGWISLHYRVHMLCQYPMPCCCAKGICRLGKGPQEGRYLETMSHFGER